MQPPQPNDKEHRVRACMGNGLRPDIWEKFQTRFGIPKIIEFYGSTEGNSIINLANKTGAVGYVPWPFSLVLRQNRIIQFDVDTNTIYKVIKAFLILFEQITYF